MQSHSDEVARNEQELALERSDRNFLPHAGRSIRSIRIRNLDVFGPSVDDTTRPAGSRLEGLLNHLNFKTRETTIRQTLLFREGDPIDPFRLAESERLLRNLAFVGDARIAVVRVSGDGDSADLCVIVQETWTLRLSGSLKEGNRLKVSLAEQNLLGLGHEVSVTATRIPDATPKVGLDTSYSVRNIHGSFVSGEVEYLKRSGSEAAGVAFSRDLLSPVFRYAGGLDLRRTSIEEEDSLSYVADNTSELVDIWTGRQFHLGHRQRGGEHRRILFISGRVRQLRFTRRPPVTSTTLYQYHEIRHVLGSVAWIQNRYYRTSLLYDFRRTEDIPHGFLARATYGFTEEEFATSPYASATLAAGEKIEGLGYAVGELRVGGYPKGGRLSQGVIRARTLYFSNLLRTGRFRFRQFVNMEYIAGIHRSADSSIDFNGDEGIRGVVYDGSVTGSKRLQFSLETVAFSPWRVQGVTFACFTFADLDIIGSGRRSIFAQEYNSGFGLGVRLHKDGYGIGSVQLRFAWYPRLPIDRDEYSFSGLGERRFHPIEFLRSMPEIVEY